MSLAKPEEIWTLQRKLYGKAQAEPSTVGLAVKPDTKNRHVGFDERGAEPVRLVQSTAKSPRLASTQVSSGEAHHKDSTAQ